MTPDHDPLSQCERCRTRTVAYPCHACGFELVEVTAELIVAPPAHEQWDPVEEAFVLDNMHHMTGREIARALTRLSEEGEPGYRPRSWKALKHWFARRNLSKPTVRRTAARATPAITTGRAGEPWTDEELEALEMGECKLLSHRTAMAIKWQAWKRGCPLRSGDGYMSLRQVADMHGIHPQLVARLIRRGLLPAQRNGALWRIEPSDAERVPALLQARKQPVRKGGK